MICKSELWCFWRWNNNYHQRTCALKVCMCVKIETSIRESTDKLVLSFANSQRYSKNERRCCGLWVYLMTNTGARFDARREFENWLQPKLTHFNAVYLFRQEKCKTEYLLYTSLRWISATGRRVLFAGWRFRSKYSEAFAAASEQKSFSTITGDYAQVVSLKR